MAGFSTTSGGLNFQYPNRDTTNWDATMANTFTTISSHDHDRDTAGRGNALTDRSILATNTGWFQATDFAGTGTVNLIRANTSDLIELGANLATLDVTGLGAFDAAVTVGTTLGVTGATTLSGAVACESTLDVDGVINLRTNSVYLTGRNVADSANINMFKVNATDSITAGADLTVLGEVSMETNTDWYKGRNNAGSGYVNLIRASTADRVELGAALDVKANAILTSTTNGDIELIPNGTGEVFLGESGSGGIGLEAAAGVIGTALTSDGTSSATWEQMGWEQIDSDEIAGSPSEVVYSFSDYSLAYNEFMIVIDSVGGSVASWPSFAIRTAAGAAITSNYMQVDTSYVNRVSNNVYGNLSAGAGTAKNAMLHVKTMHNVVGGATLNQCNFEGWFENTLGNDMGVYGTCEGIPGQLAAFNGTGTMTGGSVHLYGRRV